VSERILIIDDDVDTLKLVGLMLERQGYEIIVANNGEQGLSKSISERPDLILLDVMMPDLDGYEVARRLRDDPKVAHIPIIMFTAKSMVDDKVKGFEAGVDDYLTKPTHPAELTAHVKAVLSRVSHAQAQAQPAPSQTGKVIGFLGARGGMGTTTLALNIGVALSQAGQSVIVAEINPGRGSLALELGFHNAGGLSKLLSRKPRDIHLRSVEATLENHDSGVRFLLASHNPSEMELQNSLAQMAPTVGFLSSLAAVVLLDLGAISPSRIKPLLDLCSLVVLVMEPIFPSTAFGLSMVEELIECGVSKKKLNLALITRMRTGVQIPWRKIEAQLGIELLGSLPPAADMAHQASKSMRPLIVIQPRSVVTDQVHKMAEAIAKKAHVAPNQSRS